MRKTTYVCDTCKTGELSESEMRDHLAKRHKITDNPDGERQEHAAILNTGEKEIGMIYKWKIGKLRITETTLWNINPTSPH